MSDLLNWMFTPLTNKPQEAANATANKIDSPQGEGGYIRGLLAGMTQGAGGIVNDMTSPVGIASMAAGPAGRLLTKLKAASRPLKALSKLDDMAPRAYSDAGGRWTTQDVKEALSGAMRSEPITEAPVGPSRTVRELWMPNKGNPEALQMNRNLLSGPIDNVPAGMEWEFNAVRKAKEAQALEDYIRRVGRKSVEVD